MPCVVGFLEAESVLHIPHDDYEHVLKPEASVQVYLRGTVVDTKRSYAHLESFSFSKPPITLKVWTIIKPANMLRCFFQLKCTSFAPKMRGGGNFEVSKKRNL